MINLSTVSRVRHIDCTSMIEPMKFMDATDYALVLMAGMASRMIVTLNETGSVMEVPKNSVERVCRYISDNKFDNVTVLPLLRSMKKGKLDITVKMTGYIHKTNCEFTIVD